MERQPRQPRKTVPQEDNGTRLARNNTLTFRILTTTFAVKLLKRDGTVKTKLFTEIIPPVTPREIPIGGTRTIGGGTSREALRRASQKARKPNGLHS